MRATMRSTEAIADEFDTLRDFVLAMFDEESDQYAKADELFSKAEQVVAGAIEAVESEIRQAEYDADHARSNRYDVIEEHENLKERIRRPSTGPHPADPDPYGYHGLSLDLRQLYIGHYMRTGEYRP